MDEGLHTVDQRIKYEGHNDSIRYACVDLEDKQVCTCCADSSARIWDEATGVNKCMLAGHTGVVVFADFIDANTVVTASWDQSLKIFKLH